MSARFPAVARARVHGVVSLDVGLMRYDGSWYRDRGVTDLEAQGEIARHLESTFPGARVRVYIPRTPPVLRWDGFAHVDAELVEPDPEFARELARHLAAVAFPEPEPAPR